MKPPLQTLDIQKKRKRAKRLHWTPRNRYRQAVIRRVLHLPTRRTLTYAEAQRFVDICIDGSVSQLNISQPLCVVDGCDTKKYDSECCSVQLPSEANGEVVMSGLCVISSQQVHVLPSSSAAAAASPQPAAYYRHVEKTPEELNEEVEYDTDEQVFTFQFSTHAIC